MPLFDFECSSCKCNFEKLINSNIKPECPQCGSTEGVTKLLSKPSGFKFNGNGYYCTDFKGK